MLRGLFLCAKLLVLALNLIPPARVEHIGSSAIYKVISKGDLNIFIEVEIETLKSTGTVLKKLGFTERLDTLQTDYLCMLESTSEEDITLKFVANGSEFKVF